MGVDMSSSSIQFSIKTNNYDKNQLQDISPWIPEDSTL